VTARLLTAGGPTLFQSINAYTAAAEKRGNLGEW
jgi:hypothetical protein